MIWLSVSADPKPKLPEHQYDMAAMRMVGHQVLLSVGDSLSRVLPIEQEDGGYRIRFETVVELDADNLVTIIDSVFQLNGIANTYLVEAQHCSTQQVVYSYTVNPTLRPEAVSCKTRPLPKDCYTLFIRVEGLAVVPEEEQMMNQSLPIKTTAIALTILLAGGIGLTLSLRKKTPQKHSGDDAPNRLSIGSYLFDTNTMVLHHGAEKDELTGKEADLLSLLHASLNVTVERNVILRNVWGDEGAYVGRTLDVFISKLRKKLEADPSVRIVNVRGVGYKLIVGSTEETD